MAAALPDDRRVAVQVADALGVVAQCHAAREIRVSADWMPVEGVTARGGLLGRLSLYLTTVEDGGSGLASPPTVEWQIRATFGRFSEPVTGAQGAIVVWSEGWRSSGSIVHVSGRLVEGWELWARVVGAGSVRVLLRWLVSPHPGAEPSVTPGELT